jgi:Tol biopolymer transport system component
MDPVRRSGFLFVVHPDGSAQTQIHLHPGSRYYAYEPGWSPDGRRIVYGMYLSSTGQHDIFTAGADGTDLVQVTNTPGGALLRQHRRASRTRR